MRRQGGLEADDKLADVPRLLHQAKRVTDAGGVVDDMRQRRQRAAREQRQRPFEHPPRQFRPVTLHLSEHHGDACPGSTAYVRMRGVRDYHAEISSKGYRYLRPAVESRDWTSAEMTVTDPFYNWLVFSEEGETPA